MYYGKYICDLPVHRFQKSNSNEGKINTQARKKWPELVTLIETRILSRWIESLFFFSLSCWPTGPELYHLFTATLKTFYGHFMKYFQVEMRFST